MKIKYLPLLLSALIGFQSAGGQTNVKPPSNEIKTTVIAAAVSEEIKVPVGVKRADYEESPAQNSLLLTLNVNKQLYYQDKIINYSTLKNILKAASSKTKKLPKTTKPSYLLDDEKVNSIYLEADARVPFAEVIKILNMVRESSPNEYRAKFIVRSADEVESADTPIGRFVISFDLGLPVKPNAVPKPNPLTLVAKLDAAGKVKVNNTPPMQPSQLKTFLSDIFKERERYGVFAKGTNEIVKTIILVAAPDVKYGEVVKLVDELHEIDANPIVFSELSADYQSLSIREIQSPNK